MASATQLEESELAAEPVDADAQPDSGNAGGDAGEWVDRSEIGMPRASGVEIFELHGG